jgi:hypothetical protein
MLTQILTHLPRVTKALVATATGMSAAYAGAVDGGVSADEWVVIAAAGVAAGVAVWLAPNKPAA